MPDTLLVIEDEVLLGNELREEFAGAGWDAVLARNIGEAGRLMFHGHLDPLVVVSDINLPDGNGLDLLEQARSHDTGGEWIFLTAYGGVPESVRALKLGAFDFLEKPCDSERLQLVVSGAARSAIAQRRLNEEGHALGRRFLPAAFVGHSAVAREVRAMLERLAKVPFSALVITGETGTGKGLAARILHHAGPRASGPLVEVNCAALPHELLEAELFGHEAGAFTGAKGRRRGLIEQADGGTLFLDEIGELEPDLQAKLLKAIDDHRVRRVGGERELEVDFQVIAATNQNLEKRVVEGAFRADLFHRLAVFQLPIPPLRARKADLRELLPSFIADFNALAGQRVEIIPDSVWQRLDAYDWPGNVRELRNLVERCVLLADGPVFPQRWLHLGDTTPESSPDADDRVCLPLDGRFSLDDIERMILAEALRRSNGNVSGAARLLRSTREKLRYRVQKFGLKSHE